jgi:hypothetical protein
VERTIKDGSSKCYLFAEILYNGLKNHVFRDRRANITSPWVHIFSVLRGFNFLTAILKVIIFKNC